MRVKGVNHLERVSKDCLDCRELILDLVHVLGCNRKQTANTIPVLLVPLGGSGVSESDSIGCLTGLEVGVAEVILDTEDVHALLGEGNVSSYGGLSCRVRQLSGGGDVREEVSSELGLEGLRVLDVEKYKVYHHESHSDPVGSGIRHCKL